MGKKKILVLVIPGEVDFKIHQIEVNETLTVRWNQKTITKPWYEISYKTWRSITSHKESAGEGLRSDAVICDKVAGRPTLIDWCKNAYHNGRICRASYLIKIPQWRKK